MAPIPTVRSFVDPRPRRGVPVRRGRLVLAVVIGVSGAGSAAWAQGATGPREPDATTVIHGGFDIGYRFQHLSGSTDTYRRLANLTEGPRLVTFDVTARHASTGRVADSMRIAGEGLGGDPFPALTFSARRAGAYEVNMSWRRSRLVDSSPITPESLDGADTRAVTNAHNWRSRRDVFGAQGHVSVSAHLRLLFDVTRTTRQGSLRTSRSLDYVGAPAAWGSFARANPYPLGGPIDDRDLSAMAGLSYTRQRWVASYEAGYRHTVRRTDLDDLASPLRSLNVDPLAGRETLTGLVWRGTERLTEPVSRARAAYRRSGRFEWSGEHLVTGGRGPATLSTSASGLARIDAAGLVVEPYTLSLDATGWRSERNHLLAQSVFYQLRPLVGVEGRYRYSRFRSDGRVTLTNVFGSARTASLRTTGEEDVTTWALDAHLLDVRGVVTPSPRWSLRPGVVLGIRTVVMTDGGIRTNPTSRDERTVRPALDVAYHHSPALSVRGALFASTTDKPYTRLSPAERSGARLSSRWAPGTRWSIEAAASHLTSRLPDADYVSRTTMLSSTVALNISDRADISGGFDVLRFHDEGSTSFVRGIAPLTGVPLRNAELDKIARAGGYFSPAMRVRFAGTLALECISGTDTIDDEPPLYGPASFPSAGASVSYELSRQGHIQVDVEHLAFRQVRLPANDFRSTTVMVRYARVF